MRYIWGPYELDPRLYELRHLGTPCQLEPQVFNYLGQDQPPAPSTRPVWALGGVRARDKDQGAATSTTPLVSRPPYVGGLGFGIEWDMGWVHDTLTYMAQNPIHRKYHYNHVECWYRPHVLPYGGGSYWIPGSWN